VGGEDLGLHALVGLTQSVLGMLGTKTKARASIDPSWNTDQGVQDVREQDGIEKKPSMRNESKRWPVGVRRLIPTTPSTDPGLFLRGEAGGNSQILLEKRGLELERTS